VPEVIPVLAPGEILRRAREARGESIADLVHTLKLSQQQLEAIESGRFEALPGPTFVRGFVRNYARHLGLNPEPLLAGLEGGTTGTVALAPVVSSVSASMPASYSTSSSRSRIGGPRVNFLPMLLIVLLLIALVAAGLHLGWFEALQELVHPANGVMETGAVSPDQPTDATSSYKPARVASSGQSVAVPVAAPVLESIDPAGARPLESEPASAGSGIGNVAAVAPVLSVAPASSIDVPAPGTASAQGATPIPVAPVAPPVPTISTLRFSFVSNAWIEVREGSEGGGKLLFVGTGNAGSSRNIRGMPPFSLVVSKADKVKLEFNGKLVDLKPYADQKMNARLTLQQ
jgi:cytoskeleton protein RodZ